MTLHVAIAGWLLGAPSGANRRLLALLAHAGPLLQPGERLTVLHRPDFAPPQLEGVHWQPVAIPAGPSWRRALAERRMLPAVLRALGATVLDHGLLPLPAVDVPACLLVHDLRAIDGLTRWPRWFAAAVLRRALARAAVVVAPSAWTADRLRRLAPRAAVRVVPNGVDLPTSTCPPPARPLPANGYLLHIGHLEPRKNLGIVLAALRALPPAARPELWLAGRDAGALRGLLARGTGLAVRALGVVGDDELSRLYQHARAVVVPSRHEGFGLAALEALAHGTRVLVSDAGALPEVVGEAAAILPWNDAAAWARALAQTDDGRTAAERRARAARFPWAGAATALVAAWRAAAHAGRVRPGRSPAGRP
jgi:glycosyltransferase involved in cell wall biosynthesis